MKTGDDGLFAGNEHIEGRKLLNKANDLEEIFNKK